MLLDDKIKTEAESGRKHYVYVAKHGSKVVYVGKGKNSRYIHTINGRSRNYKLNEYFFKAELLGEQYLKAEILHFFEFEKDALLYEESKIRELQPECNTQSLNPKKKQKVKAVKKTKKVKTVQTTTTIKKKHDKVSWVTSESSSVLWEGLQLPDIVESETCRQVLKTNVELYISRAKLEGNNVYNITDWDKRVITKSITSMYESRKMKAKEMLIILGDKLFPFINRFAYKCYHFFIF
jgi:excinuclease UvrABC nuclease subunit